MSQSATGTLRSKLGIPTLAGSRTFVGATTIDSIGTGMILAFTIVYFAATTDVSLPAIGIAMTVARLGALPTSVIVGPLIDRFTARRVAVIGNLVSAVGYGGYFFADQAWSIVLVVLIVQFGHSTYWTSNSALIYLAAPEDERVRWFGFAHALRNAGIGVGGAAGALVYAAGDVNGLRIIVVVNGVSFLVAAVLLSVWKPVSQPRPVQDVHPIATEQVELSYRDVLRDRRYTLLIAVNVTLVFAQMLIKILLAIYIVEALNMEGWIAGALIVVATIQIALTQTVITKRVENRRQTSVIGAASILNAVAFGLFALLYASPEWMVIAGLFVAMFIFTLGEIIGFPAIDQLSASMAPEQARGRYLAVYQLSWTIGEVVAPGVLTFLLAQSAVLPMLCLLVLSLLAVPLLGRLEKHGTHPADQSPPAPAATRA